MPLNTLMKSIFALAILLFVGASCASQKITYTCIEYSAQDSVPGQTLPAMLHQDEQMPDWKAVEKEIQK